MPNIILDLETILPDENKIIRFKDRNGEKHEVKVFIPTIAAFTIIEHLEEIQELFENATSALIKKRKELFDLVMQIFEIVCTNQHEYMTREWFEKNVSLLATIMILKDFVMPVYQYLNQITEETDDTEKKTKVAAST